MTDIVRGRPGCVQTWESPVVLLAELVPGMFWQAAGQCCYLYTQLHVSLQVSSDKPQVCAVTCAHTYMCHYRYVLTSCRSVLLPVHTPTCVTTGKFWLAAGLCCYLCTHLHVSLQVCFDELQVSAVTCAHMDRHATGRLYTVATTRQTAVWVGLVGWPVADGLPTSVVTHQLQVERRTGKVRRPETDVLPTAPRHQRPHDKLQLTG